MRPSERGRGSGYYIRGRVTLLGNLELRVA